MRLLAWTVIGAAAVAATTTVLLVQTRWLAESKRWETDPGGKPRLAHNGAADPVFLALFAAPYAGLAGLAWLCRDRRAAGWGLLAVTLLVAGLGLPVIEPDVSGPWADNHLKGALSVLVALLQCAAVALLYLVYGAGWLIRSAQRRARAADA